MIATISYNSKNYKIDLSNPLDISIPLQHGKSGLNAWGINNASILPHKQKEYVGKVSEGAATNFNSISFNPHSHVTHTECVGHITASFHSINKTLDKFFFFAEVITVAIEKQGDDFVISEKQLKYALGRKKREALIIRTLPNMNTKLSANYSNSNPPYFLKSAIEFLKNAGIQHLLVDLPSIDKEKDDGKLAAHKAFWYIDNSIRKKATITEFIYVANTIEDGTFFLNLQTAPFENDASPSRPILYKIIN